MGDADFDALQRKVRLWKSLASLNQADGAFLA